MSNEEILIPLKIDLQLSSAALDSYLAQLIVLAKAAIEREGIALQSNSVEDGMLVEMYAAYLYRKRREAVTAMPRMLRWALNNRLFSQKAAIDNG